MFIKVCVFSFNFWSIHSMCSSHNFLQQKTFPEISRFFLWTFNCWKKGIAAFRIDQRNYFNFTPNDFVEPYVRIFMNLSLERQQRIKNKVRAINNLNLTFLFNIQSYRSTESPTLESKSKKKNTIIIAALLSQSITLYLYFDKLSKASNFFWIRNALFSLYNTDIITNVQK